MLLSHRIPCRQSPPNVQRLKPLLPNGVVPVIPLLLSPQEVQQFHLSATRFASWTISRQAREAACWLSIYSHMAMLSFTCIETQQSGRL